MLLLYGNTVCPDDWRIEERIPTGYCRVYYVYGGEVLYEDEQRRTRLKAGYLYIFPSASPYRMRQNAARPLHCTFIHIDVFPSLVTELVECPAEAHDALRHLLLTLSAAIDAGELKLLYALAEVFERYLAEHRLIAPPAHPLAKALVYIADHIGEDITVGRLSAMTGYNEQYFIRLFRRHIGMTPHQYIISYRLKEARKRLRENDSIAQVARTTGYRDAKAFSRAFRKSVGMTPSAFRRDSVVLP